MRPVAGAWRDASVLAALLALISATSIVRPFWPIDETRYVGVAWEMWLRGDFLLPVLNGEPYAHKPPLLFWLIHAGWAFAGVNEWTPRLISPLFTLGTLALVHELARDLWPERPAVRRMAPYVLIASLLLCYFASALMFDAMLSFFAALGHLGLVRAWRRGWAPASFALLALGVGGALFAKGPVAFVHLLPAALGAPWWMKALRPRWRRWYGFVAVALLVGALLILAWALPAGLAGGEAYRRAIFWGQSAGRMVESFAHRAPWYAYLVSLPLMLAPWFLWPAWWRGLDRRLLAESGFRYVLLAAASAFVLMSFVSGKRWQYLLPEFVPFALLVARALDHRAEAAPRRAGRPWIPALSLIGLGGAAALVATPRLVGRLTGPLVIDARPVYMGAAVAVAAGLALLVAWPGAAGGLVRTGDAPGGLAGDVRRISVCSVVALVALLMAADFALRDTYDTAGIGAQIAQYQREGREVGIEGETHDEWTFAGRLRQPLAEVDPARSGAWLAAHPNGRLLLLRRGPQPLPEASRVEFERPYRGQRLVVVSAR